MDVVQWNDPRLETVFQGVRQAADGTCYRQGVFKDGSIAYVDASDPREFALSKGSFSDNTLHVTVRDSEGVIRRAGGQYAV